MFRIVDDQRTLLSEINAIVSIADSYRDELGFWSPQALCDAINRNRLIAAITTGSSKPVTMGFLIYSGVHPSSKIQAIAVLKSHTRKRIGQTLLDAAISRLESEHFISVRAKPAEDLTSAQAFYKKNDFQFVRAEQGGKSRKRQIIVRERILNVPTLFNTIDTNRNTVNPLAIDSTQNQLWVIDINVLFDLVKSERARYSKAYAVFGAALAGRIHIAVTSEFKQELQRNSKGTGDDPIFALASALPTIFVTEVNKVSEKVKEVHNLIFCNDYPKQAGTPQAMSDCRHVAECILGNVAAFITSDGALLSSRSKVRERFGLDIVALDDFHDALSCHDITPDTADINAEGFRIRIGSHKEALQLISKTKAKSYFNETALSSSQTNKTNTLVAFDDTDNAIGLLMIQAPFNLGKSHKMTIIMDHQEGIAEVVADALMGKGLDMLVHKGPHLVKIVEIPGQLLVRRAAHQLGFKKSDTNNSLEKLVLGSPITPGNISDQVEKLRLLLGKDLAERLLPTNMDDLDELFDNSVDKFARLEKSVSPALLVSSRREVIIQPIERSFATELLGTSGQMNFFKQPGGSYRTEKIYVCSSNKKSFFRPNQIILFYESRRSGGHGAIVAAGNVTGVLVQNKKDVSEEQMKRTVLDEVDYLSSSKQVTLVRFNSLLKFPVPVTLETLKSFGAHTPQNFVSTTNIPTAVGQNILDKGWSNAR